MASACLARMPVPSARGSLVWALGLLLLIAGLPTAWAENCGAPSPTFQQGKTPFDEMEVRDLTAGERKMLERLFKSLEGDWEGEGEETQCRGSGDTVYQENEGFTLEAEAEYDPDGSLRIETDLRSPSQKTRHSEALTLYLADNKLRVDNDGGAGDIELVEVGSSRIRYIKRGVIFGASGGASLRQELFVTLSAGGGTFSIETMVFIQGKFAGSRVRRYRR